jgi:arylsulfatase A-like enzyme
LFEELVLCPLFIYAPGIKPGIYKGLTSAVDLMPTVLDILGQKIPDEVEGESLLPKLKDNTLQGREFVISTHPFANIRTIIRSVDGRERPALMGSDTTVTTSEWSLLYSTEPEQSWLYHLPSDAKQGKNVIDKHPDIAKELHQLLIKFMYDYNLSPELRDPRLELRL